LAEGKNLVGSSPGGNCGDSLRLVENVGGRLMDEVHQPAAWTPVSLSGGAGTAWCPVRRG
jgi:hypothetical protein